MSKRTIVAFALFAIAYLLAYSRGFEQGKEHGIHIGRIRTLRNEGYNTREIFHRLR